MTPSRLVPMLGLFLLVLDGAPAAGQEQVANGDFDTDVTGWFHTPETLGSSIAWDAMDVDALPTSGSARVELDPAASGNSFQLNQCVAVSDAIPYDIGAWAFLPSPTPIGDTFVRIQWHGEPDCDGSILETSDITAFVTHDTWLDISDTEVDPPPGSESARASLVVLEAGGTSVHQIAFWDGVHFLPEPSGFLTAAAILLVATAGGWRGRATHRSRHRYPFFSRSDGTHPRADLEYR